MVPFYELVTCLWNGPFGSRYYSINQRPENDVLKEAGGVENTQIYRASIIKW